MKKYYVMILIIIMGFTLLTSGIALSMPNTITPEQESAQSVIPSKTNQNQVLIQVSNTKNGTDYFIHFTEQNQGTDLP